MVKFSADSVFDGESFLKRTVLIMEDDGTILDTVPIEAAGDDVRHYKGALCPGFVNAHCHLELSHLYQAVPMHTGLVPFLLRVISERSRFTPEAIQHAMEKAERSMQQNGIVAVGDIANTTDSLPVKLQSDLHYQTFVETIGFAATGTEQRFEESRELKKIFQTQGLPASIVPHAPYSVSPQLFEQMDKNAEEDGIISIHNQESEAENELYRIGEGAFFTLYKTLGIDASFFRASGRSSLQSWLPCFSHPRQMLLVHNTYSTAADVQFAENTAHDIYWCLCPLANLYIESRLPGVDMLQREAAKIVIGTDSLASNKQLSVLEELKALHQHFPGIAAASLLQWATSNGAKALNIAHQYGRFQKGMRPGILLIDAPSEDILSADSRVVRLL